MLLSHLAQVLFSDPIHYSIVKSKQFAVALLASGMLCHAGAGHTQDYPGRAIRLIVGSSAGGGGDVVARTVAQRLSEVLGQQIVIDNRAGAGGNIGAELVARAAPDGYTLLFAYTGHVINPSLYKKLPFDTLRDFAPVGMIATNQTVLVVNPSVPARSVKELIALAKAQPGKLTVGELPGSSQHLAAELFRTMARIDWLFVPYKGAGPATNDLIAGHVDVMFNTMAAARPFVRAGRLRALAVAGERRSELMPDLPTISEAGLKGFSSSGWYGLLAPAGTPRAIITKLNSALVNVLAESDMQRKLLAMGNEAASTTPEQFNAYIRREIPKWAKVVEQSGAKAE